MARFYVSSTYEDLKDCRESVCEALRRLHHEVVGMENYAAGTQAPLDKCLADVASCDAYVGIFAWRYGHVPAKGNPKKKSITELEYCKARDEGKEILIFLLHDAAPWPPTLIDKGAQAAKVEALREGLKTDHLVKFFHNRQELEAEVNYAVAAIADKLAKSKEQPHEDDKPNKDDEPIQPEPLPFWKRHAKVLLAAAALVAVVVPTAAYLLKPAYKPPAYPEERVYDFYRTDKLPERWDFPDGKWSLDKGEGSEENPDDAALVVRTKQMGMPKDLQGKVFYDYRAEFKVRFLEGKHAGWVLRAQPDRNSGYLFDLECRGNKLFLKGWLLRDGRTTDLASDKEALRFSKCCDPTDGIHVVAEAVGNIFNYTFTFESDPEQDTQATPDNGQRDSDNGRDDKAKFTDTVSTFAFGSFGLREIDDESAMKVEYLYLTPLNKDQPQAGGSAPRSSP